MQTIRRVFRVNRNDINYLSSTIESYNGMAVVTTLDPYEAYIELRVSPGCDNLVCELLDSLRLEEGLEIREAETGFGTGNGIV
ncbi:MAG: DUF4911 domain-containing protein [Desulfobacteraceae bacterium]|nr:DUF4911 domain-containing protein [Desulfobacteraceae bacterium]